MLKDILIWFLIWFFILQFIKYRERYLKWKEEKEYEEFERDIKASRDSCKA